MLKLLNKINWFEVRKDFTMGSTIVMAISMCLSMWMIALGFHNMDLGHNATLYSHLLNESVLDYGSQLPAVTPNQLVKIGFDQFLSGVSGIMVTSALFGVFVTTLRYMRS